MEISPAKKGLTHSPNAHTRGRLRQEDDHNVGPSGCIKNFFFSAGLLLDLFQLSGFLIEHVFGQTPQLLHRSLFQFYIFNLPYTDGSKNF